MALFNNFRMSGALKAIKKTKAYKVAVANKERFVKHATKVSRQPPPQFKRPTFSAPEYAGETEDRHLKYLRYLAKLEAEKQEKLRLRAQLKAIRKEKFRRYVLGRLGDERDG